MSPKTLLRLLLLTLAGMIIGCRNNGALALGEYKGEKDGYVETIVLKGDGTYEHSVLLRGTKLFAHDGRYAIGKDEVSLNRFIQVYDPTMDSMNSAQRLFENHHLIYMNTPELSLLKANPETSYSLFLTTKPVPSRE